MYSFVSHIPHKLRQFHIRITQSYYNVTHVKKPILDFLLHPNVKVLLKDLPQTFEGPPSFEGPTAPSILTIPGARWEGGSAGHCR